MAAIAERAGGRLAAAAEGHGPLVAGQWEGLAEVVVDPDGRQRLALFVGGQFDHQWAMFTAADGGDRRLPAGSI